MSSETPILLEIKAATLGRLLQSRAVSLEDLHGVDLRSKEQLRRLLLEVLKQELGRVSPVITSPEIGARA